MKKKVIKKVILCALTTCFLATAGTLANARNIGDLVAFRVTKNGNATGSLKKLNSSNTIINLQDTKGGKYVQVKNYNAANGKFVGGTHLWTGTRQSFSDNSASGGNYYLKLFNAKSNQDNFSVYGSWSPDSY